MTAPSPNAKTSQQNIIRLTTAAMVTALVFLFTFLVKVPTALGYIHLGDTFILLYAAATGDPLAILAGALGEGLADAVGGYFQYVPATILIKAAIAAPVVYSVRRQRTGSTKKRVLTKRTVLVSLLPIPITLGGYFIIDYILGGAYAFAALATNAVQAVGSLIFFLALGALYDKSGLKLF